MRGLGIESGEGGEQWYASRGQGRWSAWQQLVWWLGKAEQRQRA